MEHKKLTVDLLHTAEAALALGLLVVKTLQDDGMVTLFVTREGEIEVCPSWEIPLDGVPEEEALKVLYEKGYDDVHLAMYLKGREARGPLENPS